MAEGSYEYECARAELLGLDQPNRDEFESAQKLKNEEEANNLMLNVNENTINFKSITYFNYLGIGYTR